MEETIAQHSTPGRPVLRATPISEMSPAAARAEVKRTKQLMLGHEPLDTIKILKALAARFRRLQIHGWLVDEDISGALWEAAEACGLIDHTSVGTIQEVIAAGMQDAMLEPDNDPDRARQIEATPYDFTDPGSIPRRDWLYGHLLIRKFVTASVAPGGVGKSSLIAVEALACVSGKGLLGVTPARQLRTWLWNLEDPQEETQRKIQAAAIHYGLDARDIENRLFVDSGRNQSLVIATAARNGTVIVRPMVDALVSELTDMNIDVLVIDPFVSCHEAAENDNQAMDMIVKEWGKVADRANCAVHLVHHTPKMAGVEVTTESARGGKAFTDACRVVRAINRMTSEESQKAGVENHRFYFRTFNDKANLQPPADKSDWFQLVSVDLPNGHLGGPGDSVGVVASWKWPDPLAGVTGADFDKVAGTIRAGKWRENVQAASWVGKAVAEALEMDIGNKAERAKIIGMLNVWRAAGSLEVVEREDEKRMVRKFIEVREEA